mmetsp:Transcript_31689/g.109566  ORF Transcript_31689/g.109566 Transcript_31689/m.109566 type:complete len:298 (-) Transcript_31689:2735-3628(-)
MVGHDDRAVDAGQLRRPLPGKVHVGGPSDVRRLGARDEEVGLAGAGDDAAPGGRAAASAEQPAAPGPARSQARSRPAIQAIALGDAAPPCRMGRVRRRQAGGRRRPRGAADPVLRRLYDLRASARLVPARGRFARAGGFYVGGLCRRLRGSVPRRMAALRFRRRLRAGQRDVPLHHARRRRLCHWEYGAARRLRSRFRVARPPSGVCTPRGGVGQKARGGSAAAGQALHGVHAAGRKSGQDGRRRPMAPHLIRRSFQPGLFRVARRHFARPRGQARPGQGLAARGAAAKPEQGRGLF